MKSIPFGARVDVGYVLRHCYVHATKTVTPPWDSAALPSSTTLTFHCDSGPCDGPDGLPGLPLSGKHEPPKSPGVYRLLRRLPFKQSGIAVGYSNRAQGEIYNEYHERGFVVHFRVPVLQVAIGGGKLGPHSIVNVVDGDFAIDNLAGDVVC